MSEPAADWQSEMFAAIKAGGIRQIVYVPDAGHIETIRRAHADPEIAAYPLTTEEEGVAAVCGAWLGGQRAALLMQSSGVGNCINMLSLVASCRFPFLAVVTMRGEWAEFNPWQTPMARATRPTLEAIGVATRRVENAADAAPTVAAAIDEAFAGDGAVAVLLAQRLIGRKVWTK